MPSTSIRLLKCFTSIGFLIVAGWSQIHAANILSQWNGSTGNWTNSANWIHTPADLGADYPRNGVLTYDVEITGGDVSLNTPITLNRLTVLNGTLAVDTTIGCDLLRLDSTFFLAPGSVINAGQVLLTNSSVLEFEIGSSGAGIINNGPFVGWAMLDGTLRLRLSAGFVPTVGSRYTLFTRFSSISQFSRHEGLEIGNGLRLVPHYNDSTLEVVVMNAPQPGQVPLTVKRTPWWAPPTLSWPPEYAGFYLQYTTNFTNSDWTTLFVTWTNPVNISIGQRQGFFRLAQP
jgi:hypothetical protein